MTTPSEGISDCTFPRGSEWRKWDLHFHTPSSYDYKDKSVTNETIIRKLRDYNISAVAVTDHHIIDVDRIRSLQSLAGNELTVFPGIELRTDLGGSESIHLIGIFSERCDIETVWTKLQGQLNLTPADIEAKGNDKIYVDFGKAATIIGNLGGLVSVHAGRRSNSIENITNSELFKQALKLDLAEHHIDLFDIKRKESEHDYKEKVFPFIGNYPLVSGSDNHDVSNYSFPLPLWIRADPTFRGLCQIKIEPDSRIYLGDVPSQIVRVSTNKTKYLRKVTARKRELATTRETWFDCTIPLNPGLVAIIGNKGSGKSALADIIGLVGDTKDFKGFSFLTPGKFRNQKEKKAHDFEASLEWESGQVTPFMPLDLDPDPAQPERVKYLPQSHMETICNELQAGNGESAFDLELASVIFSHVPNVDKLGLSSLRELLRHKTDEAHNRIQHLRGKLSEVNEDIAVLEQMRSAPYRQRLEAELSEKRRELDVHLESRPKDVERPELDPLMQVELTTVNAGIDQLAKQRESLKSEELHLTEELASVQIRMEAARKLLAQIANFRADYDSFVSGARPACDILDILITDLLNLTIDTTKAELALTESQNQQVYLNRRLDKDDPLAIASRRLAMDQELIQLRNRLDVPGRHYQQYLVAQEEWKSRKSAIMGDEETPETLTYLHFKFDDLANVPQRLEHSRSIRREIAAEVHRILLSLGQQYRDLYAPVQQFISSYAVKNPDIEIQFGVNIANVGFESSFFDLVNQSRKGSFYGADDGRATLKSLFEMVDWESGEQVLAFADSISDRLNFDYRGDKRPEMAPADQLKKSVTPEQCYDYVFGFEYLHPRYRLQWGGQELEELSPGERGTLLLLFYLLVDKSDLPIVIDQPEENLDNQTVFRNLVPALKQARDRRQIIIVTHNPNLAVVCDADQVICASLDKKELNRVSYVSGSIESTSINQRIVDVLEGTRPAFDNREAKYSYRSS